MTQPEPSDGGPAGASDAGGIRRGLDRRRAAVGGVVLLAALAGAGVAIWRERHAVGPALNHIGGEAIGFGLLLGLVAVGSTYLVWWEVLDGLGVTLPRGSGARIFFTTQLGKYLPGSVWPTVMQMEAGRSYGASRRAMLTANLAMIVVTCACGLAVAAAILPFYDAHVLARYWWALLAVPPLLLLLHPRTLTGLLDLAARVFHQPALGARLALPSEARAFGWSVVTWLGLGGQTALLAAAVHGWSFSVFAVSVGGSALAVPIGVLFVPAPAGAGVRDVILGLVLSSVMPAGQALAVVLASRVLAVACDLLAAVVAAVSFRRRAAPAV